MIWMVMTAILIPITISALVSAARSRSMALRLLCWLGGQENGATMVEIRKAMDWSIGEAYEVVDALEHWRLVWCEPTPPTPERGGRPGQRVRVERFPSLKGSIDA